MRFATSGQGLALAGINAYARQLEVAALGPLLPLYDAGKVALGKADAAVYKRVGASGTKAAIYQALTFDFSGLALNLAGIGKKKKKHSADVGRIRNAAKSLWGGSTDLAGILPYLLQANPAGVPFLFGDWDVLGSADRLQKRVNVLARSGPDKAEFDRVAQFIASPRNTGAFNEAQLRVFEPIAAQARARLRRAPARGLRV